MGGFILPKEQKPSFTSDQIVSVTDIQRNWRKVVEPKLKEQPFLLMFSGSEPKASFLNYEKFEELWAKAQETTELELKMELLCRLLANSTGEKALIPLKDVLAKSTITADDLQEAPDAQLEDE
ncbi:hypothetical protein BR63_00325 [Thermanaerosceptrum fracticalcis]|uniref:Uncharacterized protein n=1 Tax=Thermanaerosceptrum fracticalcis TaxID=1712410 RepID=A0A7G6DYK3_THEFR|nr:hypothetical protein BR63_00325 [Thermanaerosceptrum fracticalcis]